MAAEVAIARRRLRRNDGKAVRQGRQRQFLLHLQIPPGGELLDGFLLRQRLFPHRKGRVDVIDKQGQPVHRVEIDLHPHQDGDSRLQRLPGLGLEKGLQLRIMPFPDHRPHIGHLLPLHALGKVHIAVSVRPRAPRADLSLHPIPVRKSVRDALPHPCKQLRQLQIVFHKPKLTPSTNITIIRGKRSADTCSFVFPDSGPRFPGRNGEWV